MVAENVDFCRQGFRSGTGISIEHERDGHLSDKSDLDQARYEVDWCLRSGYTSPTYYQMKIVADNLTDKDLKKISPEFLIAWCSLCVEKQNARRFLDEQRPLPVKTEIGLSPKVTKTLKELNLDIDMSSIKPAKINYRLVPARYSPFNTKEQKLFGKVIVNETRNGSKYSMLERDYYIDWTKGIVHGQSRFTHHTGHCEACGKNIPSWTFVPLEAKDKKSGQLVSLLAGCDCAKNIFGVKDIGIEIPRKA
jgi:hypothetical protein